MSFFKRPKKYPHRYKLPKRRDVTLQRDVLLFVAVLAVGIVAIVVLKR